ncbi:hypothetical protein CWC45_01745 [Neisseria sp. N177_16]|nr:hypothetical protein CWC45_01745 [Neisseria sp. N177_16]
MQINLKNMANHWKLLLILIIVFQLLFHITFNFMDIKEVNLGGMVTLGAASFGTLSANIVFFIFIRLKKP